jgi:hypothetical protein
VGNLAGLLVGTILLGFAVLCGAASSFRIRHWWGWTLRWHEASPVVSWVLLSDLFVRALLRDRAMPRSRGEAILWETPVLFLDVLLVVVGFALITVGPTSF